MAEIKELDLDKKVNVKSIADWPTGFNRIVDGVGDVTIQRRGTVRLSRNEIISQVQRGNKLFTGTDGLGSHATLYIDDAETRVECGFDTEEAKQTIFSDALVKTLFGYKTIKTFESKLSEMIVTRAEKAALVEAIRRLHLNDYDKIKRVIAYTGFDI